MSDALATRLEVWLVKLELAELVAVLSSAVDRGDAERIVWCYSEESFDDHGAFKGSGPAFAEFVCGPGSMTRMHHLLGQSVFDVQGEEAWGETFFVFHGAAGTSAVSGCGRYIDYFRNVDGTWKLSYRRVVPDEIPVGDDLAAYWQARPDRSDPAYDRLRRPRDGGLAP